MVVISTAHQMTIDTHSRRRASNVLEWMLFIVRNFACFNPLADCKSEEAG